MNTKYINIGLLTSLGLLLSIITGCFPKTNTNTITPTFEISEDFADYCWFETGSYWVFQNDSTLFTDTIKITNLVETNRFHNEQDGFYYQAIELYTNSNSFDITRYELTAGTYTVNQGEMNSLLRIYKSDASYHLVFLPQYAIGDEQIMGDEIGTYTNMEKLESFELNNKVYQDVYHTRVVISLTNTEYHYWIAKYHSLIKATSIIDGQTSSISLKSDHLIGRD